MTKGKVPMGRAARITRTTSETDVSVELDLDGTGRTDIDTGVPFFDHMLDAFGRHGMFDLTVHAKGDTEVDAHHTVEDCGIVLGQCFDKALGEARGITRYGSVALPMDEALVLAAVDISGRGQAHCELELPCARVGSFDTELAEEFWIAFAANAKLTLHLRSLAGRNTHHVLEASFKAAARALRQATEPDVRAAGQVPSTKGVL